MIDLLTFHKAESRAKDNEAFSRRNLQEENAYLLRKLVRCGRCGGGCSATTSKQVYSGKVHCSHYYCCFRTNSGFLKQERCSQRRIRAEVPDEMIWEEVSTRLQDPNLVLEAHQKHKTHRRDLVAGAEKEQTQKLEAQIEFSNKELSRLLDAYQSGAIELKELQKRRKLVDSKLDTLRRELKLQEKIATQHSDEADLKGSLEEFAALVSSNREHISFENRQKLLRMVLEKVVVKDWRVDVYYKIPLPKPPSLPEGKVSTKFDLRSTCTTMYRDT